MTSAPPAKELRLATVLYGGVSLCIYMHGVTKEIHRLVRASALLANQRAQAASAPHPFDLASRPPTPSEEAYVEILDQLASTGVDTRVVADVIAGTSAGGINGIFLAKALAHDLDLQPLRNLWLKEGDIVRLARAPFRWAAELLIRPEAAGGVLSRALRKTRWLLPWVIGVPVLVVLGLLAWILLPLLLPVVWLGDRIGLLTAPLRGDRVFRIAYRALGEMGGPKPPQTLMPQDLALRLFVTTTDIRGYPRTIPIWRPREVTDWRHRHVLTRSYPPDVDAFTDAVLAFSARATSCFPGAFPPVQVDSVATNLARDDVPWPPAETDRLVETYFPIYDKSGADARHSYFFDGGVLDNRPFGLAIDAIGRQPAGTEVDRKLLYLEPDPARAETLPAAKPPPPRFLYTIKQALVGIPRSEPILDDLERVEERNESVRCVRDAVRATYPSIEAVVRAEVGDSFDQHRDFHEKAQELLGPAYVGYTLLKLRSVVDHFATVTARLLGLPAESNQAAFSRAVMRRWAEEAGLMEPGGPGLDEPPRDLDEPTKPLLTEDQLDFLSSFDLGYGWRRIRFVIDGVNGLYAGVDERLEPPVRADLDEAKRVLYGLRRRLEDVMSGRAFRGSSLESELRALFEWPAPVRGRPPGFPEPPDRFAAAHAEELDAARSSLREFLEAEHALGGFREELWGAVEGITSGWEPEPRRTAQVRFVGFPLWDAILYPARVFSNLDELDEIEVVRLSPRDATCLERAGRGAAKLSGAGLHHFGAFFSAKGRRSDYLWGRLDGAEQLIALLLGQRDDLSLQDGDDQHARRWCRRAFEAILEEEATLGAPRALVARIRRAVADLPT